MPVDTTEHIQQLEARLASVSDDREQVNALNALAWELRYSDVRRGLALSEKALAVAKDIADSIGVADSLKNIGSFQLTLGNYGEALQSTLASLTLFQQLHHSLGESNALNTLGTLYAHLGDYAASLSYHLQTLTFREAAGNKASIAISLNNIGAVYQSMRDYAKGLEYHHQALALRRSINDREGEGMSLNNLGFIHTELGECADAKTSLLKSLSIHRELKNLEGETIALSNLGRVYLQQGNADDAETCFLQSLDLRRQRGERHGEAILLLNLCDVAIHRQDYTQAVSLLQQGLDISEQLGAKDLIHHAHQALAETYATLGDYRKAFEHYKRFHEAEKAVFNEEADRKAKLLTIQFEVEKTQKESALQKAEAELYRIKSVELAALNDELKAATQLKSELLAIAAHDLKNPLQAVVGFTALLSEELEAQSKPSVFTSKIQLAAERMLALINDLLQTSAIEQGALLLNRSLVNVGALTATVIEQLTLSAQQKSLRLETALEPHCIVSADENRLREVLENLIGNAIKYSPEGKHIAVSVKTITNDELRIRNREKEKSITNEENSDSSFVIRNSQFVIISVKDEGQGLNEKDMKNLFGKFQRLSARPTGGESSTGLGLSIVKQLVELHGGKVWAESAGKDQGSAFIVELPAFEG